MTSGLLSEMMLVMTLALEPGLKLEPPSEMASALKSGPLLEKMLAMTTVLESDDGAGVGDRVGASIGDSVGIEVGPLELVLSELL